jgi:hypothetical protein
MYCLTFTLAVVMAVASPASAAAFRWTHPGLLHNRQDLERMKTAVAAHKEPIWSGYEVLVAHPQSQKGYRMQGPFDEIGRNPNVHTREFDQDANAAYQNAILFAVTADPAHARKSIEILDAWASTLERITGADAVLMAGLGPFKLVNAAEIIRYSGAGWPDASIRRFERLCRDVFYPVLQSYAPFANGNWDTAAVKTVLAIGVFL